MSVYRDQVGGVELTTIDYADEPGPFWYVVVDDTPVMPDMPLPLEQALVEFRRAVEDAEPGEVVELRQCTDEDLRWAGVRRG